MAKTKTEAGSATICRRRDGDDSRIREQLYARLHGIITSDTSYCASDCKSCYFCRKGECARGVKR